MHIKNPCIVCKRERFMCFDEVGFYCLVLVVIVRIVGVRF